MMLRARGTASCLENERRTYQAGVKFRPNTNANEERDMTQVNDNGNMLEHEVTLNNQQIIEMAYAHRDLIAPLIESRTKLFFEQANCFFSIYYLIRRLLPLLPENYQREHSGVVEFYETHLGNEWDRLAREDPGPADRLEADEDPGEQAPDKKITNRFRDEQTRLEIELKPVEAHLARPYLF